MFSLFNAKPTVRVSSSSKPGSLFAAPASSSASKSIFSSLKPAGRSTALFSAPPAQHVASNLFRSAAPQSAAGSSTDTSVSLSTSDSLFDSMPSQAAESSLLLSSVSTTSVSAESLSSISRDPRVRAKKSREIVSADSAKALIPSYLLGAVRESTAKSYANQFARYENFCAKSNLNLHKPESVATFLVALAETSRGKSSSLSALSGIKFNLKMRSPFKKAPTDNYFVRQISKSIVKKWSRPVKKAKCLSSLSLLKLVNYLCKLKSFKSDRSGIFFLLQYLLVGRYHDVANLTLDDLVFLESGHLEVTIRTSKNFESHDARKSYIASNSAGSFDPVRVIKVYHNLMTVRKSKFLFPNFRVAKVEQCNKMGIVILDSPVSYSTMLQELRSNLNFIGLKGNEFSLHSVRVGALSEIANSNEVDKSVLQRHGRWKTMSMVDAYHKMDLQKKLSASKALKMYKV